MPFTPQRTPAHTNHPTKENPMGSILTTLSSMGLSLLMSLMTETFLKKLVYRALKAAAASTETRVDDKLVEDVAEAWGIPPEKR